MSEEKISVIVPVYNLAPWLGRCVESILAQTCENLEVILVDDGSGDDSLAIARSFAERDSRVKVIHQENAGVTAARLRGVEEATGDWIGFVDGDDELEPQMYARLLENAHSYGADISHCGYQRLSPDGRVEYHYNSGEVHQQDHLTALRELLEERLVGPGLWNKLYKRELFRGLREKMDFSIRNNEDMLMNYYLFSGAEKAVYEDICPYHYLFRENSAARGKLNEHRIYDRIRVRQIILDACPPELERDAREALLRVLLYVYALLTVETEPRYREDLIRVREMLAEQKDHYSVLTRRNRVLAGMICAAPGLFRVVFRCYVKLFLGGEYG